MKSFIFLVMLGLAAVAPMGCDGDQSAPAAPKTRYGWAFAAADAPSTPSADPTYDPVFDPPFMPVPVDKRSAPAVI
jgi:hypothetical protein